MLNISLTLKAGCCTGWSGNVALWGVVLWSVFWGGAFEGRETFLFAQQREASPTRDGAADVTPLQPTSNALGFREYQGKYLTLVTDLPHSAAIGELPLVFEAAMPQWGKYFGVEEKVWSGWKGTCYLIGDRNRFQEAGYFPAALPPFVYGYQLGEQMWCMEQPGEYYRRHLLLHEGTHWFMNHALGNLAPPWLMEGTAEKLGTHRWQAGELTLDVFPDRREGFEYWGRLLLIKKQRGTSQAPTLEGILRYGPTAHLQVEAYAWSWAAIWFLRNHPRSAEAMARLQTTKIVDPSALTPKLLTQLRPHWNELTTSWNAWVQQLDYGGDVSRDIPEMQTDVTGDESQARLTLRVDRGWQDSGLRIKPGDKLSFQAQGRYQVGAEPEPWWCEPEGVTLDYFSGQPLGKVVGLIVKGDAKGEMESGVKTEFLAIGSKLQCVAKQEGVLFLRINEPPVRLADNQGSIEVTIAIERP